MEPPDLVGKDEETPVQRRDRTIATLREDVRRRNRTIATLRDDQAAQKETNDASKAELAYELATADHNFELVQARVLRLEAKASRRGAEAARMRRQDDNDRAELLALREEKKLWTEVNKKQNALKKLTQDLTAEVNNMLSRLGEDDEPFDDCRSGGTGRGSTTTRRRSTPLYLDSARRVQKAVETVCNSVDAFPDVSAVLNRSRVLEGRLQQAEQKCAGLQARVEHKSKEVEPAEKKRPPTATRTRLEKARSRFLDELVRMIRTQHYSERDGGRLLSSDAPNEQREPEASQAWGRTEYLRSHARAQQAAEA